ncbi:MAG: DegT/DnrJ/EryC1/StrS family aminotransferase, partial [Bdellovibrionales bacterium]|nr:DegT/DnrJ/EryC1/StrS family aminotransferase [Bdellovibrionales bacterium]
EKLVIYEDEIKRRNEIATNYSGELGDVCHVPIIPEGVTSVWALYSIKTDRRDELATFLQSKGIPTGVYYPKPLHLQEAFANLSHQELPVSKRLSEISLSLPMHPYLTDDQVEYITSSVRTFYGR